MSRVGSGKCTLKDLRPASVTFKQNSSLQAREASTGFQVTALIPEQPWLLWSLGGVNQQMEALPMSLPLSLSISQTFK